MAKVHIVLPAYNESANIEDVVAQWYPVVERLTSEGNDCRIVVANDGSKDDTWSKLSSLSTEYDHLTALDKPNSGHGSTVLYLYRYAIAQGADYVFQTDSDGQTVPDEFFKMWENRESAHFHIGVRANRQDGFSRIIVTKVLRIVVYLTFRVWVKDANTPFRLMASSSLDSMMKMIPDDFFLANVAVSALAVKKQEPVRWYPVTFKPRQGGVNSINLKRIFKIGLKAVGEFRQISKAC